MQGEGECLCRVQCDFRVLSEEVCRVGGWLSVPGDGPRFYSSGPPTPDTAHLRGCHVSVQTAPITEAAGVEVTCVTSEGSRKSWWASLCPLLLPGSPELLHHVCLHGGGPLCRVSCHCWGGGSPAEAPLLVPRPRRARPDDVAWQGRPVSDSEHPQGPEQCLACSGHATKSRCTNRGENHFARSPDLDSSTAPNFLSPQFQPCRSSYH